MSDTPRHRRGVFRTQRLFLRTMGAVESDPLAKTLALDLVLAKRLESPRFAKTTKSTLQDKGVHLQLSYAFF